MPTKRQDQATAATGYTAVAAGGAMRGGAVDDAHRALGLQRRTKPSGLAVLRAHKAGIREGITHRYVGGSAMVTVGAPAAALGTYNLARRRRRVTKAFGFAGDKPNALKHASKDGRARCGKVTTGTGLTSKLAKVTCPSCLSRLGVSKRRKTFVEEGVRGTGEAWQQKADSLRSGAPVHTRAVPIAVGAGSALGGSLAAHRVLDQVGRKVPVHGKARAAITTAAAVPATLATLPVSRRLTRRSGYDVSPTGTHKVAKSDYLGRHVSAQQQRARITLAGATPIVGPALAARQAEKYAPPHHKAGPVARQVGVTGAATYGGYKAGQAAHRKAQTSPRFAAGVNRTSERLLHAHAKLPAAARKIIPARALTEKGTAGAAAFLGYKAVSGAISGPGTQTAISRDLREEHRYDARQHEKVGKAVGAPEDFTDKQRHQLIRRKKVGATANVIGGTAGLTALGMLASKHPAAIERRAKVTTVAAGIGGLNAFNSASIGRREAKAEKSQLSKAAPIQTNLDDKTAHKLVHGPGGYGLKGPLPKGLDRDTRKTAYEARYVASGGHKRQRWSHVADAGDKARNAGLAGGVAAGAAWLGAGSPRTRKLVAPLKSLKRFEHGSAEHVKHHAERAAVASATFGALGELTEEGAKRKRAAYSTAPAGIAAGALNRMNQYTP